LGGGCETIVMLEIATAEAVDVGAACVEKVEEAAPEDPLSESSPPT